MSVIWWGATLGAGVAVARHAWSPAAPSLGVVVASLHGPRDGVGPDRSGGRTARSLSSWWTPATGDLAITGRSASRFGVQVVATPVALVGLVGLCWMVSTMVGAQIPSTLFLTASVSSGALGLVFPSAALHAQARRRRLGFGHALSAYLDLVAVLLAGGAGVETSLMAAAEAGDGWAFELLRNELVRARARRQSPWNALASLGQRLELPELVDLATTVQLAGTHGARVRSSLTARAAAVRDRHLAQVEAEAQSATERMGLPMVLVFIGFIALLGYPALALIMGGL